MRKLKSTLFVVMAFFAVVAFAMGIAFMPKNDAFAAVDTTTGFYVEDGAGVRFKEGERGIRWTGHMSKTFYDKISEEGTLDVVFGLAIAPQVNGQIDWENQSLCEYDGIPVFDGKQEISFNVAIYYDKLIKDLTDAGVDEGEIPAYVYQAYTMNLFARPYYKVGDGEIQYDAYFDTGRSMQGIALYNYLNAETIFEGKTLEQVKEIKKILLGYINYGKNETNGIEERDDVIIPNAGYYSYYDALKGKPVPTTLSIEGVELDTTDKLYAGAKDITSALNEKNGTVNYTNLVIEGVEAGTEGKLTLLKTNGDVYTIPYTYVTLAIDEAEDFDYFSKNVDTENAYTFADGDVEWDGYYIMLKNIDASGYSHVNKIDTVSASSKLPTIRNANKGLTGTFDGMGHTVSNYSGYGENGSSALIPIVNGGIVKNLGLNIPNNTEYSATGGAFIGLILNNSTIQDCKINFGNTVLGAQQRLFCYQMETTDVTITRIMATWDGHNAYETGPYLPSVEGWNCVSDSFFLDYRIYNDLHYQVLSNNTIINEHTYCTQCVEGNVNAECTECDGDGIVSTTQTDLGRRCRLTLGARYIDGVEQFGVSNKLIKTNARQVEADELKENQDYQGEKSWEYTLFDGAKVYTNTDTMKADKANNSFANWSSEIWTVVDGIPYFNEDVNANFDAIAINDEIVASSEIEVNVTDTVKINAASGTKVYVNPPVVKVVSGAGYTLVGNSLTFNTFGETIEVDVTYDGVTQRITFKVGTCIVKADGRTVTDSVELRASSSLTFSAFIGETEIEGVTASIVEGDDVVTVDGATVYSGEDIGSAVIRLTTQYGTVDIQITVVPKPILLDKNVYTFSAYDGLFFNGDTPISLSDILSNEGYGDSQITKLADLMGNELELTESQAILGYKDLNKNELKAGSILLTTNTAVLEIPVRAATLIIDDASDMDYFQVKQNLTGDAYGFAEGDFEWNGYYEMVKDIDLGKVPVRNYALGVTIDGTKAVSSFYSFDLALFEEGGKLENKGLTGMFDGKGHTIKNITATAGGSVFGVVNGGTIKNVGLYIAGQSRFCLSCGKYGQSTSVTVCSGTCGVKPTATTSTNGSIANVIAGEATFTDIYVESDCVMGNVGDVLMFGKASTNSKFTRFIITYGTSTSSSANMLPNGNGGGPLVSDPAMLTQFENSYFVSGRSIPLHAELSKSRVFEENTLAECEDCNATGSNGEETCEECGGDGKRVTASENNTPSTSIIYHTDAKYVNGVVDGANAFVENSSVVNVFFANQYFNPGNASQRELSEALTLNGKPNYEIVLADGFKRVTSNIHIYYCRRTDEGSPHTNSAWDRTNVWKVEANNIKI